ncbi:MAG: hypothetical protein GY953_29375, partial [bacterium]|nr:hypothetical protein [bacterium]
MEAVAGPSLPQHLLHQRLREERRNRRKNRPSSFYEDPDGVLWIGTRNRGLNRFHRGSNEQLGTIEQVTTADELTSVWALADTHSEASFSHGFC